MFPFSPLFFVLNLHLITNSNRSLCPNEIENIFTTLKQLQTNDTKKTVIGLRQSLE